MSSMLWLRKGIPVDVCPNIPEILNITDIPDIPDIPTIPEILIII